MTEPGMSGWKCGANRSHVCLAPFIIASFIAGREQQRSLVVQCAGTCGMPREAASNVILDRAPNRGKAGKRRNLSQQTSAS